MPFPRRVPEVLSLAVGLFVSSRCLAIPNAYFLLETQTQSAIYGTSGVAGQSQNAPGSIGVMTTKGGGAFKSNASASLSAGVGTSPDTSLSATASYTETGNPSGSYPFAEATAELVYALTINGPSGGAPSVDITFSAHVSGAYGVTEGITGFNLEEVPSGETISISSSGVVTISGGTNEDLFGNGYFGVLTSSTSTPIQIGTSSYDQTIGAAVGTSFLVEMSADALVDPTVGVGGGFPPPASITATIDPTFTIDSRTPNASAYSISYSPNLTPEPTSISLAVIAFAASLFTRRFKERATR